MAETKVVLAGWVEHWDDGAVSWETVKPEYPTVEVTPGWLITDRRALAEALAGWFWQEHEITEAMLRTMEEGLIAVGMEDPTDG